MDVVRRPVFWILLAALTLRLWGIGYGLPQFFVNDERAGVYGALKMLELKTLVPAWHDDEFRKVLNYLPLPSYLYLIVLAPVIGIGYLFSEAPNVAAYRDTLVLDPTLIFLAARIFVALLGTLSVFLTYRLAKSIFASERTGLLASLFLALSFYHIQLSHVTRHWMFGLLFVLIGWLAAEAIYRHGGRASYLAAGLASGLGVGANTASAVALVPAVLAHFLRPGGGWLLARLRDYRLWLACAVALAVALIFIWLYPYGLTQGEAPAGGGDFLAGKLAALGEKSIGEWLAFLWFYARLLLTYETTLILASLIGAVFAWFSHCRWLAIAAIFSFGYLTILYLFFNVIERGILFVLPVFAVFAGYGLDRAVLWFQSRIRPTLTAFAFLFSLFAFLFFAWPLAIALRFDSLLTRTDTRLLASNWLSMHTSPEEKILADLPYLRLTNTRAGIAALASADSSALRIQDRVLARLPEERYPLRAREVLNLHLVREDSELRRQSVEYFREHGYRWFVVERKYLDGRDFNLQSAQIARSAKLAVRFAGFRPGAFARALDLSGEISTVPPQRFWELERFGLIVDVYEL